MNTLQLRRTALSQISAKSAASVMASLGQLDADVRAATQTRARDLVKRLRQDAKPGLMETFLSEYGLSTDEGVALMCLAEALLRVPDSETMDALIEDKIAPSKWGAHINKSSSNLVNASTWALMLTGRVLDTDGSRGVAKTLRGVVKRLGEPVIRTAVRQAMREMGKQFVLGETIQDAIDNQKSGYRYSYDMLGEAAISTPDALRYLDGYQGALEALTPYCNAPNIHDNPGISVKLSALHPRYEVLQHTRVMDELLPRITQLARIAAQAGIGLNIDAEEADRLELSLDIFESLARDPDLANWDGLGLVVQAYSKRADAVIDWIDALAQDTDRRFMVRLVKGAYWDSEIKHAQVEGHALYPVWQTKSDTDKSYLMCAQKLLDKRERLYPQFATHNAHTTAGILALAGEDRSGFEFQRLHGMGEALHRFLREDTGLPCRIYAPVGIHRDLLAYLVRRLLENGANSSFVSQITDEDIPVDAIITDPFDAKEVTHIPLPPDLLGARQNSRGFDLADSVQRQAFEAARAPFKTHRWTAYPQIASPRAKTGKGHEVINPANPSDGVGTVRFATLKEVETAIGAAKPWAASVEHRAKILRKSADALETHHGELFALLAREAGKTAGDAIAELREAVDFLRYYADAAEAIGDRAAAGIFTTIAPWNFPLAIFLGQAGAALAAGNAVLAKPAETTSLIAFRAVEIMHAAGIPKSALQCLPGEGVSVGAALTSDPRINGVCFTGSTATAQAINLTVAKHLAPHTPLIAETGGINAMIVDSTALPQQAVNAILDSAFRSAGQRCSALRLVYLQDEIYEPVLKMLREAMAELHMADPWDLSTDIGPVIDAKAQASFAAYIDVAKTDGGLIATQDTPATGHFIGPTLIRVAGRAEVTREIFGPILHVAKFDPEDIPEIISELNSKDYALTFGLHTRIDTRVENITTALRVGNIYVNRNQIGAVVGSQPFGGSGLSGTGPKAGGPDYLHRFYASDPIHDTIKHTALSLDEAQARIDATPAPKSTPLHTTDCIGPTGESNRLSVFARGKILCLGPDTQAQAKLVEAQGGTAVQAVGLDPSALVILHGFSAVIHWGTETEQRDVRRALAQREGPILPLACGEDIHWAVTTERHVCIDTTASGGNTTLLAGGL